MDKSPEERARQEYDNLTSPDRVKVKVMTSWVGPFCLPDPDGKHEVKATFRTLTYGDNMIIEKACTKYTVIPNTTHKQQEIDISEMRRLVVKRCLLDWSLPIPIERQDDWMTAESYRRASGIPAPLMECLLDEFESKQAITKEEEETIMRQSAILFGKSSRGVADACEAVSLYCTLGNYWEKFGLDRFSLINMPYREFSLLRMMIGRESQAMKIESTGHKPSNTRVVMGNGGRSRASRGVAQAD